MTVKYWNFGLTVAGSTPATHIDIMYHNKIYCNHPILGIPTDTRGVQRQCRPLTGVSSILIDIYRYPAPGIFHSIIDCKSKLVSKSSGINWVFWIELNSVSILMNVLMNSKLTFEIFLLYLSNNYQACCKVRNTQ